MTPWLEITIAAALVALALALGWIVGGIAGERRGKAAALAELPAHFDALLAARITADMERTARLWAEKEGVLPDWWGEKMQGCLGDGQLVNWERDHETGPSTYLVVPSPLASGERAGRDRDNRRARRRGRRARNRARVGSPAPGA